MRTLPEQTNLFLYTTAYMRKYVESLFKKSKANIAVQLFNGLASISIVDHIKENQ